MAPGEIEHLKSLLEPSEIISPNASNYAAESLPFATNKDRNPLLVIRPKSVESLSKAVAYLANSSLDFKVRSQGFGSASAKDVVISLTAFDQFEFDRENETLLLGAGQSWTDYYKKMEENAPEYSGKFFQPDTNPESH